MAFFSNFISRAAVLIKKYSVLFSAKDFIKGLLYFHKHTKAYTTSSTFDKFIAITLDGNRKLTNKDWWLKDETAPKKHDLCKKSVWIEEKSSNQQMISFIMALASTLVPAETL